MYKAKESKKYGQMGAGLKARFDADYAHDLGEFEKIDADFAKAFDTGAMIPDVKLVYDTELLKYKLGSHLHCVKKFDEGCLENGRKHVAQEEARIRIGYY